MHMDGRIGRVELVFFAQGVITYYLAYYWEYKRPRAEVPFCPNAERERLGYVDNIHTTTLAT